MTKTLCSRCAGPRVVYFRLDSDWYDGGDLSRINGADDYLQDDPDLGDTLEISGTYCLRCGDFVDTHQVSTDAAETVQAGGAA